MSDELIFEDDISEPTAAANGNESDTKNNKRKHDSNDTNGSNGTTTNSSEATPVDEEEDDEEEEEEEAEPFQPVTDGRDITLENRSLNKFLTCSVCTGYFREAHTITECLHTFCRSCIVNFWQKQEDTGKLFSCPKCLQAVGAAEPIRQCLRLDRVIQSLVDKIMPNYAVVDEELKAKIFEPLTKQKSTISSSSSSIAATPTTISSHNSFIICQLLPETSTSSSTSRTRSSVSSSSSSFAAAATADIAPLPPLPKPWLRTALQLTVRQAKKYLVQKSIVSAPSDVEITCRGEILGNDHTLDFIKKTRWHATALARDWGYHDTRATPIMDATRVLVLHYRRSRPLLSSPSISQPTA